MKKNIKKFIALVVAGCMCFSMSACSKPQKLKNKAALALKTNNNLSLDYIVADSGEVYSSSNVHVSYATQQFKKYYYKESDAFKVTKAYFKVGDQVHVGDLLCECVPSNEFNNNMTSISEQVLKLEKTIEEKTYLSEYYENLYNIELDRQKLCTTYGKTYDDSNLTTYAKYHSDYDKAVREAKIQLNDLNVTSGNRLIYADIDGVVSSIARVSRNHNYGKNDVVAEIVTSNNNITSKTTKHELFEIGETYNLLVDVNKALISTGENSAMDTRDDVNVEENIVTVKVKCVSITVDDPMTNIGDIKFELVDNGLDSKIIAAGGTIEFINEKADGVVVRVPNKYLITTSEDTLVYILNDKGEREIRSVKTGIVGNTYTEIKEGIVVGEKIIVDSSSR